ncbi:hypothetical protein cce_3175 [Crocosphaera subtropica ATCC 51142]|uniref:Uncharacterized protein n=2 Tax=Crocosphaera TaxID=263510 RepID=B1WXI2_CROS5|nr:hypothetical protein cce_3175 [Crocosphaera subtropica ATCC 51142]
MRYMKGKDKHPNPTVVDLAQDILLRTTIPLDNHAALRSGFAGYPINPRWNVNKVRAWKTGRQLRQALQEGELIIRSSDSMLVPSDNEQEGISVCQIPTQPYKWMSCAEWVKQLFTNYQTV